MDSVSRRDGKLLGAVRERPVHRERSEATVRLVNGRVWRYTPSTIIVLASLLFERSFASSRYSVEWTNASTLS